MPGPLHLATPIDPPLRASKPAKWVAERIGEDLSTIYKLLRQGEIEGYNGGAKAGSVMVYLDSVQAYQARRAIAGAPDPGAAPAKPKPSRAAHGTAVKSLRDLGLRL